MPNGELRIAVTGWDGRTADLNNLPISAHGVCFYLRPIAAEGSYQHTREIIQREGCHFWLRVRPNGLGRLCLAQIVFTFQQTRDMWVFYEGGVAGHAIRKWVGDRGILPEQIQQEIEDLLTTMSLTKVEEWLEKIALSIQTVQVFA